MSFHQPESESENPPDIWYPPKKQVKNIFFRGLY